MLPLTGSGPIPRCTCCGWKATARLDEGQSIRRQFIRDGDSRVRLLVALKPRVRSNVGRPIRFGKPAAQLYLSIGLEPVLPAGIGCHPVAIRLLSHTRDHHGWSSESSSNLAPDQGFEP